MIANARFRTPVTGVKTCANLASTERVSLGLLLSWIGVGGIAVGIVFQIEWSAAIAVAVGTAVVSVAAWGWRREIAGACAWTAMAALATAYGALAREHAQREIPAWVLDAQGPVTVDGRLARDASEGESGVRLEITDVRVSGPLRSQVALPGKQLLVLVGGTVATPLRDEWTAGQWVQVPARLRIPPVIRNPGAFSPEWQRLTRPFDLIGAVKSGALVEVNSGGVFWDAAAGVRRGVRRVATRWLAPWGAPTAAVATAILIGDRAGLGDDMVRQLQAAGTFHVIAISGGNVAILTAVCLFLFRMTIRGERGPLLITLSVLIAYGWVVGRDASVIRAIVAATLYLSLRLCGIVPRAVNVLSVTALVCAAANPLMVVEVGAWLSFGATFGLILVLPRLSGAPPSGQPPMLFRLGRVMRGLLLATVAVEIVILPVTAAVFMRVGVAGIPLNFVAIPAMTMAQVTGLALCIIAPWWNGGAAACAGLVHIAVLALTRSAGVVDIAPWLTWRVSPPPMPIVAIYYLALAVMLWPSRPRWLTRVAAGIAVGCGIVMASLPWVWCSRPPQGWLRLTMLDVGQGDALAVQLPGGHALLVDAGGSAGGFDVGGRVVAPALWASGVRRLDWLAITHGDVDHLGGARRVLEELHPREIWEGIPVPGHPLLELLQRAGTGVVWRRLQKGHHVSVDGVAIDVLHPPQPDWERRRVRNDDSLALRLRFGRVEILLTGDAGAEFESAFVRDPESPPIRILKVAHHGSRTSSSERFLDAYAPTVALISVGQGNLFGHPAPQVIDRLRRTGVDVFRTDRDGAVVIETDGREANVRGASGRALVVTAGASPAARPLPSRR